MKTHLEAVKRNQIRLLHRAGRSLAERGFYLGGGTALAVYLGHRVSMDLDWFTSLPMGDALMLAESLRREGLGLVTVRTAPGTLHATMGGVQVSFFEFRYPLLQPVTPWKEMGCRLASLDDLACMKLAAIAQRGERKDFCDLYALGTKHRPLRELIRLYQRKFDVQDISSVLYGLVYFDDAESGPMPRMLLKVRWDTIKATIQEWVKDLADREWTGR